MMASQVFVGHTFGWCTVQMWMPGGLNWLLFAAAGVAHDNGGLGVASGPKEPGVRSAEEPAPPPELPGGVPGGAREPDAAPELGVSPLAHAGVPKGEAPGKVGSDQQPNPPGTLQREGSVSGARRGSRLPAFG